MNYILNNLECFNDYEEAYLKITNNSNLYYVTVGKDIFVAWENINTVAIFDNNKVEYEKGYYDVINGELILTLTNSVQECLLFSKDSQY